MEIRVFTVKEVNEWVHTPAYQQLAVVPITPHRALSYFHNPRGHPDDPVCFTAWEEGKLIGFRTVLADHIPLQGSLIRFGWLSGVWVDPSYRRMGIARKLLEAALEAWDHKLMTHNNTPISRSVYMRSGHFQPYHIQLGKRFYLRFDSKQLLAPKHPLLGRITGILGGLDGLGNALNDLKWKRIQNRFPTGNYEPLSWDSLSLDWKEFIEVESSKNLSQRGPKELLWMNKFPWIKEQKGMASEDPYYPFSSFRRTFTSIPVGVSDNSGSPEAFLQLCQVDAQMIIPFYFGPKLLEKDSLLGGKIYHLILHLLLSNQCNTLTIYHATLVGLLEPLKRLSLYEKPFEQVYLASSTLLSQLPDPQTCVFQDGEGDFGFTG